MSFKLEMDHETLDPARAEDRVRIAAALVRPGLLHRLVHAGQAREVVSLLRGLKPLEQANALCTSQVVWDLAQGGQAAATLALVEGLGTAARLAVLASNRGVEGLCQAGLAPRVVALIASLESEGQVWALTAPKAIDALVCGGQGSRVLALVAALEPTVRERVLAHYGVVSALARNGLAAPLLDLVEQLDDGQRAQVLAGEEAVESLAKNGQAARVARLLEALRSVVGPAVPVEPPQVSVVTNAPSAELARRVLEASSAEQQAEVLSDWQRLCALVDNGQATAVLGLIESLAPVAQARILTTVGTLGALLAVPWRDSRYRADPERIWGLMAALPVDDQARILGTPGQASALISNGQGSHVVALLEGLSRAQRASVFAASDIVGTLAQAGHQGAALRVLECLSNVEGADALAAQVGLWQDAIRARGGRHALRLLALVARLDQAAQARIVAQPGLIATLAKGGHAAAVLRLLERLSPEQLVSVACSTSSPFHDGLEEIAVGGQGRALLELVRRLPDSERRRILVESRAVSGLARSGFHAQVLELLETLAPAQLRSVLTGPDVLQALVEGGLAAQALRLIESLAAKDRREVLDSQYDPFSTASDEHLSMVDDWRARLGVHPPRLSIIEFDEPPR